MENPTDNVTVTSLVTVLKPTVLIPTPLLFLIGKIDGVVLFIPFVLLKIVTSVSPSSYLTSKSFIKPPVFPSNAINLGAEVYPLPPEVMPIESNVAKESTFII